MRRSIERERFVVVVVKEKNASSGAKRRHFFVLDHHVSASPLRASAPTRLKRGILSVFSCISTLIWTLQELHTRRHHATTSPRSHLSLSSVHARAEWAIHVHAAQQSHPATALFVSVPCRRDSPFRTAPQER